MTIDRRQHWAIFSENKFNNDNPLAVLHVQKGGGNQNEKNRDERDLQIEKAIKLFDAIKVRRVKDGSQ